MFTFAQIQSPPPKAAPLRWPEAEDLTPTQTCIIGVTLFTLAPICIALLAIVRGWSW